MKNVLVLSAFIAPFFLNGCDDVNTSKTEEVLLTQCEKQSQQINCHSAYNKTLEASENFQHYNADDHPFEQQGLIFIMEDRAFKHAHPEVKSIGDIWFDLTGKQLYGAVDASKSNDVKEVGDKYVLSPQMYDELINAVKTCNRSTIEGMQFKMGDTLSAEQYDKVMSVILDCKKFQLEQALQQK